MISNKTVPCEKSVVKISALPKFAPASLAFLMFYCLASAPSAFAENEMIQVTVEVVEVLNSKAKDLGVKWVDTIQSGEVMWGVAGRQPEMLPEIPSVIKVGDWARWSPFTAELKMLIEKGAAKIMSKPKLLTRSGSEAKVLVGGQFPVVAVAAAGGTSTVEWKDYGISLIIKPSAVSGGRISATVTAEVSRLDWSNKVQGYPAVVTRNATTDIIVKSGDTLTIAGLTESKKEEQIKGVPVLMYIPILGELFKRRSTQDVESTVVIFVTPSYVN